LIIPRFENSNAVRIINGETMEIKAFILVQTEVGSEREVYSQLGNLNEVEQVYELFGEWDIIIRVKVDSIEQLDGFVSDIVRKTEGVTLTSTTLISR
tara:strand:+ start:173 stop:463 length:291 start_codon:yes stop_codon:yes gene_type:complete